MRSSENSSSSCLSDDEKALELPCSEWWPVPGTVTGALDGFGLEVFDLTKDEGGKYFFLYASCTPSSSCDLPQHAQICIESRRGTNFECFTVMSNRVSKLTSGFFLNAGSDLVSARAPCRFLFTVSQ